MKNKVIFLAGPTAVGKTAIALHLASYLDIEIISVDSALIYRDLDIGSAKPSLLERKAVPHHLIDIISPLDNYSVMQFINDCNRAISEVCHRGKTPILVGGTMMYFNALINGISELPEADLELRNHINEDFIRFGNKYMHDKLKNLDELSAIKINVNDTQRIQRALEVCILTGKSMSDAQASSWISGLQNCDYLPLAVLPNNRYLLHERINQRFISMLDNGFIEEVKHLQITYPLLTPEHNSMRSVGYRQVWSYLGNQIDYAMMVEHGKAATRQLAKRQITWLRGLGMKVIDDENLDVDILLQKARREIDLFCS